MSKSKDNIDKIIDEINEHERLTGRRVSYGEWMFKTRGMNVIVMPKRSIKKRRNYTPWSDEEIEKLKKTRPRTANDCRDCERTQPNNEQRI